MLKHETHPRWRASVIGTKEDGERVCMASRTFDSADAASRWAEHTTATYPDSANPEPFIAPL